MWKWTLDYLDHLWLHVQMKGCRQRRHREIFPQNLHLHLRQKSTCLKCEVKECTRKHSGSEPSGEKSAELLDARHVRRPVRGSHTLVNADRIKMPGTRAADEVNFRRGPATSHQLESVDDENVSKKARVVRNVLRIRGEDHVKFDFNEEAWPNAELAIHSTYEGALIDGLPADKVKAGDEREIQKMRDLQLYSWVKETEIPPDKSILLTGWARRMKGSEVTLRCSCRTPVLLSASSHCRRECFGTDLA